MVLGDPSQLALVSPATRIDDMLGATVLPGVTDAHLHWHWTALTLKEIELFAVPSKEEALRRVAEAAAKAKAGDWLTGRGWAQSLWPGGAFPTAGDLDAVALNNPVLLK